MSGVFTQTIAFQTMIKIRKEKVGICGPRRIIKNWRYRRVYKQVDSKVCSKEYWVFETKHYNLVWKLRWSIFCSKNQTLSEIIENENVTQLWPLLKKYERFTLPLTLPPVLSIKKIHILHISFKNHQSKFSKGVKLKGNGDFLGWYYSVRMIPSMFNDIHFSWVGWPVHYLDISFPSIFSTLCVRCGQVLSSRRMKFSPILFCKGWMIQESIIFSVYMVTILWIKKIWYAHHTLYPKTITDPPW